MNCSVLREKVEEPRWLTIPNSRLVVNPWNVTEPYQYKSAPWMTGCVPLHLGCYFGESPIHLPFFWAWRTSTDLGGPEVTVDTTRAPHEIVEKAHLGGASVEITTCFPEESVIAQRVHVRSTDSGKLVLRGHFDGDIRFDDTDSQLRLVHPWFHALIATSRPPCARGKSSRGIWTLGFEGLKAGDEIVVAASFMPVLSARPEIPTSPAKYADPGAFRNAHERREQEWDRLLEAAPHPMDFDLHLLDRPEATPDALRRMYYRAWVFALANSLPPMPENDYPFPQIACGKPSLWPEGHPKARPSAQWESFVAMQLTALVDPETAWASFEGLMSLVDKEGTLGGEGLPSRHVQTAWVLYRLTGDRDRLANVYPAMKRLLVWKASDPRWIFKEQTPPGLKDAEFVVHALMDMFWATRVCKALDMPEEVRFWEEWIERLGADYQGWFWETPGGTPWFTYRKEQGRHGGERHSWALQGLALPERVLGEPQKQSLLELLRSMLDDSVPYGIRGLNKHPQVNYAMIGVWTYGKPEEVARMAEYAMSAVTMAGEFSECYSDTFPVKCWGVTPSMFGAASMIDCALWHNGIILGDGLPIIARVAAGFTPASGPSAGVKPAATGLVGVENLHWKDGTLNVRFDPSGDGIEIWGSALGRLTVPQGFTVSRLSDGTPCWQGQLSLERQVTLVD